MGRRVALALLLAACSNEDRPHTGRGSAKGPLAPAQFVVPPAEDGWPSVAKDLANTRFVQLDQITPQNVGKLEVAWTFDTGILRGHEGAPLVIGDRMYIVTPFPNHLVAFDARNGRQLWRFEPQATDPTAQGVACCDVVNRGAAYANGKVIYATLDNQAIAVDATTGTEVWRTKLGEIEKGETMTMAPIVVRDVVMFGNSGGEMGVRGWITALDVQTGAQRWRAFSTGPDEDVKIGPRFKPFYEQDRGKDLGVTTWPPDRWKQGGGTVWGWLSYDPKLDLVFYGTANPGPWNADMRPGDNKWTAGMFARDPATGDAIWFYQWSPHDEWDHDGINESIVADLVDGRRLLLHPERNGYIYVLDRATGEVLSADPYVRVTTSRGVDLKTGRLQNNAEMEPKPGRLVRDVCPFAPGAKDWNPSAFSPLTGLMYIPHNTMCMDEEYTDTSYIAGTPYIGATVRYYAEPGRKRGAFTAWDPIARKAAWEIEEDLPVWSGALVTSTGVVFYGTLDGTFKAVDAKTGALLWSVKLSSGIIGQPVSYRAGGRQYVAIFAGVGGWPGAIVSLKLDVRDMTAANGWGNALHDLPSRTKPGGTLYVFALP
jgi:PQQ-dependent dehydrogenase (methanol/ethanol family)